MQTALGDVVETIREIKSNAPHWFQSQYRAVTATDYETVLRQLYSDIQDISVFGGEDAIPSQPGKVFISIKPKTADVLSDVAKQTISRDILRKYNLVTVTPTLIDPTIYKIVLKSVVQFDPNITPLDPTVLRATVYNLLDSYNTSYIGNFLESYYNSRLSQSITELDPSIVSVNTRVSLARSITALGGSSYDVPQWSYGNRLYHPATGFNAVDGGILSTNLFTRTGKTYQSGFDEDGAGNIRLYDYINNTRVYVDAFAGNIDYTTGTLQLKQYDIPSGTVIDFTVIPDSFDVIADNNVILQIDTANSAVYIVDKNDLATLRLVDLTRSA